MIIMVMIIMVFIIKITTINVIIIIEILFRKKTKPGADLLVITYIGVLQS